jgi:hypothetical protein
MLAGALAVAVTVGSGAWAPPAGAVILPAVTLDGPSEGIVGFGGVAMAEDGNGGVVYLKDVEGTPHVFVSRFVSGHWLAPIRVDTEEPYGASWPRIAATEGGELVVVWATAWATRDDQPVDELLSATLGPGASSFGAAQIVDPNIDRPVGTSPDLSISSTDQGDVVYRVVTSESGATSKVPLLRPGDVTEEVRVAHFNGETWTDLGAINRDLGVSMRSPTEANAPKIAVGPGGNGAVVWQEPEITGVARIWARRIFGASLDYPVLASAETYDGIPISDDAEAPEVAVSYLGEAEVAYRQPASSASPLPGPRIFVNSLPNGEAVNGSEFTGAIVADTEVAGGKGAAIGTPTLDIDAGEGLRLLYESNGTPRVVEGNDKGLAGRLSLGPAWVGNELAGASVMDPEGGGISAWPSADPGGDPAVAIREDFLGGGVQTGLVGGGAGGTIGELAVGRSTLGDGLVAWMQGPIGDAAIVATEVSAPPGQFAFSVPRGWVRPAGALVTWQPPLDADGPLTYHVVVDGREVPTHATLALSGVYEMHLPTTGLSSGRHSIQVLATDRLGASTLTGSSTLRLDGVPPTVQVVPSRTGTGVVVTVSDHFSGVNRGSVAIDFGDGTRVTGQTHAVHSYARAGDYRVVVVVRDKLGNAAVIRQRVSAR